MGNEKLKMKSEKLMSGRCRRFSTRLSVVLAFFIFHSSFFIVSAQDMPKPTVTAAFVKDSVMIGDQVELEVRIEKDMMQMVDFPFLAGSEIMPEVEVMGEFPADTIAQEARRQTIRKRYLFTIWKEGDYNLGLFPALYADKNVVDTLYARDSLRIRVATFDIDLQKDKPFDIKPPRGLPLRFGEIGGWFFLSLGILAILVLGVWLLTKYRHRIPLLGGERPKIPPHVEAIRRLEALRHQKLPQNGKHKQYYSGITDILREYLDRRFGIGAMEMTSGEILAAVDTPRRAGEVDEKRYTDLAELLTTADLVKFAKFVPEDAESETAWYNAYYFVEETKLVEIEGRAEESEKDI